MYHMTIVYCDCASHIVFFAPGELLLKMIYLLTLFDQTSSCAASCSNMLHCQCGSNYDLAFRLFIFTFVIRGC